MLKKVITLLYALDVSISDYQLDGRGKGCPNNSMVSPAMGSGLLKTAVNLRNKSTAAFLDAAAMMIVMAVSRAGPETIYSGISGRTWV